MAMFLMVLVILVQVVARYVFNSALPWPDEAARFLMLWMTGVVAPSAYRWGGFVSIDMFARLLPRVPGLIFGILLFALSLVVLVVGLQLGLKHVNSGWLFASSTLKLPLDLFGLKAVPIKLAWMYMSLPVGLVLLISVNVELMLKCLVRIFDPEVELPSDDHALVVGAE
ncbi:TRAP transporter small permease [Rhodovulum sp. YNF3179]|uniref:TRAP transporter small permease n=1 Tax=Rhodovulum sp. YNF3179 TaxID=3425127 RepID=UPI003D32CDFE